MRRLVFVLLCGLTRCLLADSLTFNVVNIGTTNCNHAIQLFTPSASNPNPQCGEACSGPSGGCQNGPTPLVGLTTSSALGISTSYPYTVFFAYGNGGAPACAFLSDVGGIQITNYGPTSAQVSANPNGASVVTLYIGCYPATGSPAPTNCHFNMSMNNPSGYAQPYGLFHSGNFTGTAFIINAGQTAEYTVAAPNCDPENWALFPLNMNSFSGTGAVSQVMSPGGTVAGSVMTGITNSPQLGNELNITNVNFMPVNTNAVGGIGMSNGVAVTNVFGTNVVANPIQPSNYTNVNTSIVQGLNQVINSINGEGNLLSNAISHISGGGGGTNIINVSPDTNSLGYLAAISNYTSQIMSNVNLNNMSNYAQNFTNLPGVAGAAVSSFTNNALPMMLALASNTAAAYNSNYAVASQASTLFDTNGIPNLVGPTDGVVLAFSDANGHGILMTDQVVSLSTLSSAVPKFATLLGPAQSILKWLVYLGGIYAAFVWAEAAAKELISQRQLQAPNVEAEAAGFGGNGGELVGVLFYAPLIAAIISGLPAALFGLLSNMYAQADQVTAMAAMGTVKSDPMWAIVTALVPVGAAITVFIQYCAFRWLYGLPVLRTLQFLIFYLVA